jgi:hypothetical protein
MTRMNISLVTLPALCCAVLLGTPQTAAAQNSTFITPFQVTLLDPCTGELVDLSGSATTTLAEKLNKDGSTSTSVSVVTKGSGIGQTSLGGYVFSESTNFSIKAVTIGETFDSSFSDKLALKGDGPTDNWVVREYLRLKIDALGNIQIAIERFTGDLCKG